MSKRFLKKLFMFTLPVLWGSVVHASTINHSTNKAKNRDIPAPLIGVTIDDVDRLPSIVQSLKSLARKPTARIVFDEYVSPHYYVKPVNEIYKVSYVMGELLDSFYVKEYSVKAYLKRTKKYLDTLGTKVDIWEIGNEINGNWLGDTPSVVAKMTGAYDIVKGYGCKTALTLYHDQVTEDMLNWAEVYVPHRMKQGLDYVFVSFYEDDQNGIKPDWDMIFERLAKMFPNSKIGFGEVGTRYSKLKESYIDRYYKMDIAQPNFVGGYFWWYFKQDMVPRSKPLWRTLNNAITEKHVLGI